MTANFSDERRQLGIAMIRDSGILSDPNLTENARITYAAGLLIADDDGRLSNDDLITFGTDPKVRAAATEMLNQARS